MGLPSKRSYFSGVCVCVFCYVALQWYPGDGRVLPLEEALRLVSRFVRQEMQLRSALFSGDAVGDSHSSSGVFEA